MNNDLDRDPMEILSLVHQQAFFDRLAQSGLFPTNSTEADELLKFAGKMRSMAAEGGLDLLGDMAAIPSETPVQAANDVNAQNRDKAIRQKAQELSNDPTIYNAVLSLREIV